jgi:hypothetical protein
VCNDNMDLDVEGMQGPGDTFNPNPIDEPMHDGHAEIGWDKGLVFSMCRSSVNSVGKGGVECVGEVPIVEAFVVVGDDQDDVIS